MLSARFFIQTLVGAFITMIFIYLIKKVSNKMNIPVVKDIANEV